jgi:hypothetical protein
MPDIKLYDYQKNPHPRVDKIISYFVPETKTSVALYPKAPWVDGNMFSCFYDKDNKLVGVRFVYADGTYKDLIEVEDES